LLSINNLLSSFLIPFFLLQIFISHLIFAKPCARCCVEYKNDSDQDEFKRKTSKLLSLLMVGEEGLSPSLLQQI
jgi:hypothetical protein